jgi:signal transduction histidine kinase
MSLADLEAVLDQVRGSGLAVDLMVEGTPGPLAPSVDLTAYRIIQEALTNTVRHANAARAAVTLSYEPGFVTVSVTDSGPEGSTVPVVSGRPNRTLNGPVNGTPVHATPVHGTCVHETPVHGTRVHDTPAHGAADSGPARDAAPVQSGGFGLAGIAERVASCGGSLTVGPAGAGGFAVTARLPAQ